MKCYKKKHTSKNSSFEKKHTQTKQPFTIKAEKSTLIRKGKKVRKFVFERLLYV
jgi:hypothetical protein